MEREFGQLDEIETARWKINELLGKPGTRGRKKLKNARSAGKA